MNFSTRVNGKLLLTGEYFVTEGATALALPTLKGQRLAVTNADEANLLHWQSFDEEGSVWFDASYKLDDFSLEASPDDEQDEAWTKIAEQMQDLLLATRELNADFLADTSDGVKVETHLEFPRDWGLGSSSTLVSMVAQWAEVNPYELLAATFEGSGYDIAAATARGPILFRRFNGKPESASIGFSPSFHEQLYFVYLNEKQNSREALVQYMVTPPEQREVPLPRITQITHNVAQYAKTLEEFETLIAEHEQLVQSILQQPQAKELYFDDFWGEIKSLGAWGGDFVLATSREPADKTKAYFSERGFDTVIPYNQMVL